MERKEGRGRPGAPNSQQEGTPQKEQAKPKGESELSKLLEEKRLFAAWAPKGRDPESYPIEAMKEIQSELDGRIRRQYDTAEHLPYDLIQGAPMKALDEILIDKMYSLRESTQKVERAFEIIAHPVLRHQELKKKIEDEFVDKLNRGSIDEVVLSDEELEVISKMTRIRSLPFDPEKRVYNYTEVPGVRGRTGIFARTVFY